MSPLNVRSSPQVQVQLQRSKWSKKQESEAGVYLIAQRWRYTFFFPWIVVPSSPHTMTFPKNICFVSRWWQLKYLWEFSPRNLGKMNPFWRAYFSDGLVKNHQPGLVSTGKTRQSEATHLRDGNHLGTVPYLWVDLGIRRVFVMPKCGEFSKGIRAPKMAERFRWRIYI